MPTPLTGVTTTDPTTAPTLNGPAATDAVASAAMNTALQALLNDIAWIRNNMAGLGLGNTFAFGVYFLTPLAIPFVLRVSAWKGVWLAAAAAAVLAFVVFPKPASVARGA